jgi:hypothetical protein
VKLYPRLLPRFAQEIMADQADLSLEQLETAASGEHPLMTWPATGARRVTPAELERVRGAVLEICERHGYPEPPARRAVTGIDRELAVALTESTELTPAEADVGPMWSFLALVLLPDVVWWRAAGSTNKERFVATDLTRHTLARLWWRAHLFTHGLTDHQAGLDLWRDTSIGEADLDQIQTRRGGFGKSPKAFRALMRAYPRFDSLAREHGGGRRELWRTAYLARLLRLGAFVDFNGMAEDELTPEFARFISEFGVPPAGDDAATAMGDDPDAGGDPPPGPTAFDDVPLKEVVVRLTESVRAVGIVPDEDLCEVFSRITGINVPASRRDVLRGIAWHGKTLGYLSLDDQTNAWSPGQTLPAADRRWHEWSVETFKARVAENGAVDLAELAAELFSGRAGKTVRRLVSAIVRETQSR